LRTLERDVRLKRESARTRAVTRCETETRIPQDASDQSRAIGDLEPCEQTRHVRRDPALADAEGGRDLLVRVAARHEADYLGLPSRDRIVRSTALRRRHRWAEATLACLLSELASARDRALDRGSQRRWPSEHLSGHHLAAVHVSEKRPLRARAT